MNVMAYTVQCDHDQLDGIVQRFQDSSENARATLDMVRSQVDVLRGGAWIGPNADKFYEIMDNDWFPAMERVDRAMAFASESVLKIQKIMKDADESNKTYFPT
jgi:WXG100 family type VII secretion target